MRVVVIYPFSKTVTKDSRLSHYCCALQFLSSKSCCVRKKITSSVKTCFSSASKINLSLGCLNRSFHSIISLLITKQTHWTWDEGGASYSGAVREPEPLLKPQGGNVGQEDGYPCYSVGRCSQNRTFLRKSQYKKFRNDNGTRNRWLSWCNTRELNDLFLLWAIQHYRTTMQCCTPKPPAMVNISLF